MDQVKLDLTTEITNLDGSPLDREKPLTFGEALGQILVLQQDSKDPLRSYLLAKKITENKGEIELDKAELSMLKESVEASKNYITLVKGQLLEKLL